MNQYILTTLLHCLVKIVWISLVFFLCMLPALSAEKTAGLRHELHDTEISYVEASSGFYLAIGSFRSYESAQKLATEYHNFRPLIILAEVKGNQYFRVVIGPLRDNEKASTKTLLYDAGLTATWIFQVRPGDNLFVTKKTNHSLGRVISTKLAKRTILKKKNDKPFSKKTDHYATEVGLSKKKSNLLTKERNAFKPGATFSDCDKCPELVVIPAGGFTLGGKSSGSGSEKVGLEVFIPNAFAIGRFEITVQEWTECAALGGCSSYIPESKEWALPRNPVTNVSWNDSLEYIDWISNLTGIKYRLPTEAEWEYAAKAGSSSKFWWGDDLGINQAACQECGSLYDGVKVAPVGTFSPNAFGLYDTAGNLWEWTQDCYELDAYKKHKDYPSPVTGNPTCSRVLRGGAWDVIAAGIETSFRFASGAFNRSNVFGFRVVRDID